MSVEKILTATSPCVRFVTCELEEQVNKLKEEADEVEEALREWNVLYSKPMCVDDDTHERKVAIETAVIELMMEMLDVQTCINTMFEQLKRRRPFDYNGLRKRAEVAVIQKNLSRGYYAEVQQ